MALHISPIPILTDNYAWLIRSKGGPAAIVDPSEYDTIRIVLEQMDVSLELILLTHHHADHVAAAKQLSMTYGAKIVGADADHLRLPPLDLAVVEGNKIEFGGDILDVIATPGHTKGHIVFYSATTPALFTGDTLFSMGCGRLFEGTALELYHSLRKFDQLSDDTMICCGHEYTQENARFALSVDPNNPALMARAKEVNKLRQEGRATVPITLGIERQTNPFLRAKNAEELRKLRMMKDQFL